MNKEEREEALRRAKHALRVAHRIRKGDLERLDYRVWEFIEFNELRGKGKLEPEGNLREDLKSASRRNMLAKSTIVGADGKTRTKEILGVKQSEPYQKRPSVRAAKKHRDLSSGPGD